MKTFNQIDQVWEAYCKMTDVEVSDRLTVSYNPSETTEHKVEIFSNGKSIYISKEEARLLGERLIALTLEDGEEKMKRYYNQGIAAKGHDGHEDGDSLLWAALLLAAGEEGQAKAIRNCQDMFAQMYRAPSRVGKAEKNSFSRDMATGFTLAAASHQSIRDVAYTNWIGYTLENGCEACKEHDGRCLMTPGIYWWAHYMGVHVPWHYRWTAFLNRLYLFIACFVNPVGYQLHLAGVSLFIQKKIGQWGRLEQKAAEKLAKRQPKNAFFQWLAGNKKEAKFLLDEVKIVILYEGQGRMHQWCWEREDEERAWKDSCGHDIVFMDLLLSSRK